MGLHRLHKWILIMKFLILLVLLLLRFAAVAQQPVVMNGWKHRADTIAVDVYWYTSGGYGGTNWNNWGIWNSGVQTKANLIRKRDGSNTGFSVALSNNQGGADNGTPYCATPTSGFPTEVYRHTIYMAAPTTLTFTNLDNNKKYDYVHLGSRNTATHSLQMSSQSQTVAMQAAFNCSDKMQINGLVPSSGTIVITVIAVTGTFTYTNAFYLIEH